MSVVGVPKNRLILIAGLVWSAAGAMVSLIGLPLLIGLAPQHLYLYPLALAVFLAFSLLVFSRLVQRHTGRVRARSEDRLPFWHFFDVSSWIVMAVMMGGGITLRVLHLVPNWIIAFFYTGLGLALFLGGLRFLGVFARRDVLVPAVEPVRDEA